MSESKPKLSFIAKQARVRCEFSRQHCVDDPNGADEIIERAKKRLRVEKEEGRIAFYRIFATRLRSMWKMMIERDEPLDTVVAVTVASGAPAMAGLKFEPANGKECLGYLTIEAPAAVVKEWQPFFVKLAFGKMLKDAKIDRIANPVQLQRLWEHGAIGRPVVRVPIQSLPAPIGPGEGHAFKIFEDTTHQDVSLVIYDVNKIMEKDCFDDLTRRLSNFRDKMNARGSNFEIQFEEIVRAVRSASRGPERYGLDLPMVLLAAFDKNRMQVSSTKTHVLPSVRRPTAPPVESKIGNASGLPKLSLHIASDGMEAKVLKFDPGWYAKFADAINLSWLMKSAEEEGVTFGITEDIQIQLKEAMDKRQSLEGLTLARGQMLEEGREPFIHKSYEDVPVQSDDDNVVSIRDRQQHGFVNKGGLVAELRFKFPSRDKITVKGKVTAAASPSIEGLQCGDGVQQSGQKFVAKFDGMPVVEALAISMKKGLVHNGNVDLSSGNVRFNGDVTITGNVEQGALVEVQGNVTIGGSIIGGDIRVEGGLTVKGGISGVNRKAVFVTGDLKTAFIENSKVRVRGNLTVERSILTSEVHCGGSIEVLAKDSQIVGSQIYAEIGVSTANFGRANGAATEAFLGCSHSAEKTHKLKMARLRRLSELKSATDLKIRQLHDRPEQQKTDRHRAEEADLASYAERLAEIVKRCETLASIAKDRINLNKDAAAKIREVLAQGARFTIAGKKFVCREPVAGVVLRLTAGSVKIEALEEAKSEAGSEKKAS